MKNLNHPFLSVMLAITIAGTCLQHVSGQNLAILSTEPSANANNVAASLAIEITFNSPVDAGTADNSNILITGNLTGVIAGSFSGGGTSTISFDPLNNFVHGEVISVTLTEGLTNALGQALPGAYNFQFIVGSGPSPELPTFFREEILNTTFSGLFDIKAGDIDSDGDMDIAAAWAGTSTIAWYENDGNQNFTERVINTDATSVVTVHMADVNQDGIMDIISGSQADTVEWYENDGAQNFTQRLVSADASYASVVYTADIDGDGDTDLISGAFVPVSTPTPKLIWYENDGAENFTENEITGLNLNATDVQPVDIDGDGDLDLLITSEKQAFGAGEDKLVWLENDGAQNFTEQVIDPTERFYSDIHAMDIDNDGDVDFFCASLLDRLSWYENDGDQNFTEHEIGNEVNQPRDLHRADIDGDGDIDVLHVSELDDAIIWYENDGDQNFTQHFVFQRGPFDPDTDPSLFPWVAKAVDIDQDGDIDVLGAFRLAGQISMFENTVSDLPPEQELIIYNGISTRANEKNDFFRIENIESFPGNIVEVFNRWGQKVFEIENYNNQSPYLRFDGTANVSGGDNLVSGTYFYVISTSNKKYTGFLHLRR